MALVSHNDSAVDSTIGNDPGSGAATGIATVNIRPSSLTEFVTNESGSSVAAVNSRSAVNDQTPFRDLSHCS